MKKILLCCFLFCSILFVFAANAQIQKLIGDCTISYKIVSSNSSNLDKSGKKVYISNKESRTDLETAGFLQSVIYDDNTKTAVVLRELNGEKYMSVLNEENWKKQNAKYEGMVLTNSNETKSILGYKCNKVKVTLKDGSIFSIYYCPSLIFSCSENPLEFKNIPGVVLEYEAKGENNQMVTFTATAIDFNPVPHYKFEIPKTGYRILN